jgi:hypothetical protein
MGLVMSSHTDLLIMLIYEQNTAFSIVEIHDKGCHELNVKIIT